MRLPLATVLALTIVSTTVEPAAAAPVAAGPGRVVVDVGDAAPVPANRGAVAPVAAAMDDGSVVVATGSSTGAMKLVRLDRAGRPDPGFGTAGVARVELPPGTTAQQPAALDALPGGGLVLTTTVVVRSSNDPDDAQLTTLDARGRTVATRTTDIQIGAGQATAVDPVGRILLLGSVSTGRLSSVGVLACFTPDLQPDLDFGDGGRAAAGFGAQSSVVALADGSIVMAGFGSVGRVDASGRPLGPPVAIADGGIAPTGPNIDLAAASGGAVDVLRRGPDGTDVVRVDATGVDAGFGPVAVPRDARALIRLPDGSLVVASGGVARPSSSRLTLTHLATSGTIESQSTTDLRIAGGAGSTRTPFSAPTATALGQSGLTSGLPVARRDGRLVVPGRVSVGDGDDVGSAWLAAAAVRADGGLVATFGGPAAQARVRATIPLQRARTVRRRVFHDLGVVVTASGPGLVRLEAHQGGRVVARSTAWVPSRAARRVPALLTVRARHGLRAGPITVRVRFRDLVGQEATTTARGRLG